MLFYVQVDLMSGLAYEQAYYAQVYACTDFPCANEK